LGDKTIDAISRRRAGFTYALKVPVTPAVIGINLPVIAAGIIAPIALDRAIQILERRAGIGQAVYELAYGVTARGYIDVDGRLRVLSLNYEEYASAKQCCSRKQSKTLSSISTVIYQANSPSWDDSRIRTQVSDGGLRKFAGEVI